MRILHSSDWHLGQNLLGKSRKDEHDAFLDWLIETMNEEEVDVLLVSGDIFDNATPPNYALEAYYNFLRRVPDTKCRTVVITGGNHDSIATLHAPRELLKYFQVHVIGGGLSLEEEIIIIYGDKGQAIGIICAVPYLRERDVRKSVAGESYEDKGKAYAAGVARHYSDVWNLAVEMRIEHTGAENIPICAMGHLFIRGGICSDSVREHFVGSLGQISPEVFPQGFDYVALGHLHRSQTVSNIDHIRYSGSPIALSFSEKATEKKVILVDLYERTKDIREITVPERQSLDVVSGELSEIQKALKRISPNGKKPVWIEVLVRSDEWIPDLQGKIMAFADKEAVEILAIRYDREDRSRMLTESIQGETLDDLSPENVFDRLLEQEFRGDSVSGKEIRHLFLEIYNKIQSENEETS